MDYNVPCSVRMCANTYTCVYTMCFDGARALLIPWFCNVLLFYRRPKQMAVSQGFPKLSLLTSRILFSKLLINVKSASHIEMFNQLADCCQYICAFSGL